MHCQASSNLTAKTCRIALDTLSEAEQKATTYGQELVKSDNRGRLMTLTAPVDGTAQQLAMHTAGGVVTPADALMCRPSAPGWAYGAIPASGGATLATSANRARHELNNKDLDSENGGSNDAN